ncbi:MAG: amidohydrolase [Candidatus Heimdallarchaeota archaeon]|nr:MAG: amidohydrolase [Candidatus Heimdallarchaeota archaeon]
MNQFTVITGGTLIDGTGAPPIPNSTIIVVGSKIIDVGPSERVNIPSEAKIIDVEGKTVIPSFIDSHTHFLLMGVRTLTTVDLSTTNSIVEVVKKISERISKLPSGSWLTGHGWDESTWTEKRYPNKDDLDPISLENPLILTPCYGHLMVVNSRALELAKITKETPDPPGGKIDRDSKTNEATGILREEAMDLIGAVKPPTTKEAALSGLKKACDIALSWGCASIHDLGSDSIDINTYQTAVEEGFLKVRAYIMPDAQFTDVMLDGLETLGIKTRFGDDFLRIGAIKFYIDGSMGARTAVFSEPYTDESSTYGLFAVSPEELKRRVIRAHELGMQVAIHAIGDKGIQVALDAIEAAIEKEPRMNHRHRIEHCEILTEAQMHRIKQLGVVPAMQPNFVGEWGQPGGMYEQRLGSKRLKLCNPYKKLLDEEITVAFGSDCGYCPPWPFNPIYGLWAAINHPIKENQISLEEAIKCYTLNGAYASFDEDIKGSIEPGKLADITILSEDLISFPLEKIKKVKVELTMVNGEILWKAR